MTKLLSDRIRDLHLRPDAPYPSEILDGKQMIKEWRHAQRLHLIRPDDSIRGRDSDDVDPDPDLGGEAA